MKHQKLKRRIVTFSSLVFVGVTTSLTHLSTIQASEIQHTHDLQPVYKTETYTEQEPYTETVYIPGFEVYDTVTYKVWARFYDASYNTLDACGDAFHKYDLEVYKPMQIENPDIIHTPAWRTVTPKEETVTKYKTVTKTRQVKSGEKCSLCGEQFLNGEVKSGWVRDKDCVHWTYYNKGKATNTKKTGWIIKDGKAYYVKDNVAYTGWHYMSSAENEKTPHWSYFDKKTGAIYTGWKQMGKAEGEKITHWSYFGPNGWLRTGWQKMATKSNPDGKNKEHWSYFGSNGWLRTGWVQLGKGTNNPDGNAAKHWSYFGDNGWLRTGWTQLGKGTNNPDGNAAKHWSYFGSNGWLRTGWVQLGKGTSEPDGNKAKHWSYFGSNGWLRTGLQTMGRGTNNPDGNAVKHQSYFGNDGWLVTNKRFSVSGKSYTADSRGWVR